MALGLLQGAIAIAGLVLVYSGFLAARGDAGEGSRSADKYILAARLGIVPVVAALLCSGMGVRVLRGGHWGSTFCASWLIVAFEILLAITGMYAIIAGFLSTS